MRTAVERRFPAPLAVPAPAGAEGWQELYPSYLLFSEENAAWENGLFWYWDGLHRPDVEYPFDTIMHEAYMMSVSAALSKIFPSPAGRGAVSRILNGRLYLADVPFGSDAEAEARAPHFARRAGYYFEHWNELSDNWVRKVQEVTADLEAIEVPELPDLEDEAVVTEGLGVNSGYRLLSAYSQLDREPLPRLPVPLRDAAPGLLRADQPARVLPAGLPRHPEQAISDLTAGVELMQFRPDEELKRLATKAVELGLGRTVRAAKDPEATLAQLREDPAGRDWVADFEGARDTWFSVSMGRASSTTSARGPTTSRCRGPRSRATSRAWTGARRPRGRARTCSSAATG